MDWSPSWGWPLLGFPAALGGVRSTRNLDYTPFCQAGGPAGVHFLLVHCLWAETSAETGP
jgi:hypothetical protein